MHSVEMQAVDVFGPNRVGFLKFVAKVTDQDGDPCPGCVFMRGGSVAVLPILEAIETGKKFTILVQLNSVPTASVLFPSIPAGMIDSEGHFSGHMAREIKEETGLIIHEKDLTDMTELAYGDRFQGMYPSVGGLDEYIRLFTFCERMKEAKIFELHEKLTGLVEEQEKIILKIIPFEDLWYSTSDGKALSALTLYENLKKQGKIKWEKAK